SGSFEISGYSGVPETSTCLGTFSHTIRPEQVSTGEDTAFLKWVELVSRSDDTQNDLTLENVFYNRYKDIPFPGIVPFTPVLMRTPGIFKISPPWHLSYLDKLFLDGRFLPKPRVETSSIGTWLPFFYNDQRRSFFVLPSLRSDGIRRYYPEIKKI